MKRLLPALLALAFASFAGAAEPPRLVVPTSQGEYIGLIAITPDGRWALSSASSNDVKLWAVESATELGSLLVGKPGEESLVGIFARNDTQFYIVGSRSITIVETPSLKIVNRVESPDPILFAAMSPDGESVFVSTFNSGKARIMALRRGRFPLRQLLERPAAADNRSMAFNISPDGRFALLQESVATPIRVIRIEDGNVLRELALPPKADGATSPAYSIGWTAAGKIIFSKILGGAGTTNELSLIDPETQQVEWATTLTVPAYYLHYSVQPIRRAGQPTVLKSIKAMIVLDGTRVEGPFKTEGFYLSTTAFDRDNRHMLVGTVEGEVTHTQTYRIRRFDRARGAFSAAWSQPSYDVSLLSGSPRGDAVFVSDKRDTGRLIRLSAMGIKVHTFPVRFLSDGSFSPDGASVVYNHGSHDRFSVTLDVDQPARPRSAKLPFESVARSGGVFILSPSGKLAADVLPGPAGTMICEPHTGRPRYRLGGGHYSYSAALPAAFSADDRHFTYFVSREAKDGGRTLLCHDLTTGELRWTKSKLDNVATGVRYSMDGKTLYAVLAGERAAKLLLLDPETGETRSEFPLPKGPFAHRPAFNPEGTHLALAIGDSVALVELATGRETQRLTFPALNLDRVSFLGNDRLVSTGPDQALRLWDVKTGALLGTMTVAKDSEEWAFVHPSGRFEASEGFQEQMYFVQGATKVPLTAYFETYYTPGLLGQILAGQPIETPAVQLKDLAQPPRVFVELAGGGTRNLTVEDAPREVTTETATLQIVAQSTDSPVTEIRLYHNGKLIESRTRNLVVEDDTDDVELGKGGKRETVTVALLPGENTFRAVALNAQRTESKPAQLVLDYRAAQSAESAGRTGGGLQLHLFVVGINTYKNPKYNLNYAVSDATAVRQVIERAATGIFTKVNVVELLNEKATRGALLGTFTAIAQQSGPRDVFLFYYAGHGVMSGETKPEFFLAPHELTQLYGDDDQLRTRAISSTELLAASQKIPAQKQLFLLDACQSAGALETFARRGAAEEKAVAQLARASGTHWITASGSEQFASEFEKLGHGAFTYALLEALNGKAGNNDGRVTVNSLKAWLETQVPELTKLHKGTPQYPASYGFGQDFPVGVIVR